MRFVAKYPRYNVVFQRELIEHYATGESREIRPFIACQFSATASMLPYEVAAARERFVHYGVPTEVDMVTHIDPITRFSVFDSEECQRSYGFDDETRFALEQHLLNDQYYGIDFSMVEEPRFAPPWPTYDNFRGVRGLPTPQAIAKKVLEDGYEVEAVLAYERQNANRQEVLDALTAAAEAPVAFASSLPEEEFVQA